MGKANLIEACRQGDKDALGQLYSTYSMQMMKLICHYIADCSVAQDILHDGFLIIFSRIGQLRDVSKLEYWMGTIMKNLSLQYLKETDFTQLLSADFDIPDTPEFEETISMEELEVMINRLPKGYKNVFRLAVLEHKTHKEIGKLLGISEQTSGSQLFHARVMLRRMISEYRIEIGLSTISLIFIFGWLLRNNNERENLPLLVSEQQHTSAEKFESRKPHEIAVTTHELSSKRNIANRPYAPEVSDTSLFKYLADTRLIEKGDSTSATSEMMVQAIKDTIPYSLLKKDNAADTDFVLKILSSSHHGFGISVTGSVFGQRTIDNSTLPSSDNPIFTNPGEIVEENIIHKLPLTFSVNISKNLSERWCVESGIQYTLLQSKKTLTTRNGNKVISTTTQHLKADYISIPLKIRYKLLSVNKFSIYAGIGECMYIPVHGKLYIKENDGFMKKARFDLPIQWAINGNIGVEYNLTPKVGLFAEPSINYYFKTNSGQPIIWQDKPLDFSLPIGVRFNW